MATAPKVDIGIVTTRDDELRAVLGAFPGEAGVFESGSREYVLRYADAGEGERYAIAIARRDEPGDDEAHRAARDLLEDLAPRLVLVIGIASGLPSDDVKLGDVVISTRIDDLLVEAQAREAGEVELVGRLIPRALAAAVSSLAGKDGELGNWTADLPAQPTVTWTKKGQLHGPKPWREELRDKLEHHYGEGSTPRAPVYAAGPLASSDRLVKDSAPLISSITTARDLLAIQTGSGGAYRALWGRCPVLAILGISDIVGLKRTNDWTKYACASAAAFTRAFLRTRPLPIRAPTTKPTILFLAADPGGTDRSSLDEEARFIQVELERIGYRDHFELETRWAAEPLDLLRELRKLKPAVVHFSGREGQHGLFFRAPDGGAQIVSTAAFAETFGAAGTSVQVVVLDACYTDAQAEVLLAHVPSVVGTSGSIDERAARAFAVGFYTSLGERGSVAAAYQQGSAAIRRGPSAGEHPHLKVGAGVDPDRLILEGLPEPSRSPPPQEPPPSGPRQRRKRRGRKHVPSTLGPRPDPRTPAFVWLHVSDIHFGAGSSHWRFDQKRISRAIVADAATCPWPPDRIFVTGDLAFSAKKAQYVDAYQWLVDLARSVRAGLESVRVVPGNHDVDRQLAGKPISTSLHASARTKPEVLDGQLEDEDARGALSSKLGEFKAFLARLDGHPPQVSYGIDWIERISAREDHHGPIRMVGLSSVWISDALDGRIDQRSSTFVPNMLVGQCQLEALLGDTGEDEMVFVLTHHPPDWMVKASAQLIARGLARYRHIHLCGHVHDAGARYTKNFGMPGASFRYVAGAAHGDESEASKHGYAWGALRFQDGHWEVGWAPRIYVPERDRMLPDRTGYNLDPQGFDWQRIDLPWRRSVATAGDAPGPPAVAASPTRTGRIDFKAERERHVRFVRRETVLAQLDSWLDEPGGAEWVVVIGGPGMGKSAIVSEWLARREKAGAVVPHHFIRRQAAGWDQPEVIAASLAAQIELGFPGLRIPDAKPEPRLLDLIDQISKRLGPVGRQVIVIDGLDQTLAEPGENPLQRFLPHVVPKGIRFLCTTRPPGSYLDWMMTGGSPVRSIDLDTPQWRESNEDTVRGFWEAVAPLYEPQLPAATLAEAIARAEGNVMHAEMLHRAWRDLPAAERRADLFPHGLKALIGEIWDRSVKHPEVRAGLGLLCAAREALSLDVVAQIAGWDYDQKARFEREARQLLLQEPRSWAGVDGYRPRHDWVRELIIDRLGDSAIRAHHGTLLEKLARWPTPPEPARRRYALRHALAHRVAVDDWGGVRELALSLDYLEARARAGDSSALQQELADLAARRPDQADLVALAAAFARELPRIRDNPAETPGLIWNRLRRSGWSVKDLEARIATAGAAFLRVRKTVSSRERGSLERILGGHKNGVVACAVTRDGRRAVSASDDRTLKVWDLDDGRALATLEGHTDVVTACAVTSDGRRAISASADRTLKVWDLETGQVLKDFEGHTTGVNACAISPDDARMASGFADGSIRVWDLVAGQVLATLDGHTGGVTACAFTPDGRGVVSASADRTLKVWNLETGSARATLEGHTAWVHACVVTSDGRRVVSASTDRTLKVWDLASGRILATLKGHGDGVTSCAVTSGNRRVISASHDRTLKVWDLETGGLLTTLEGHPDAVIACAAPSDGRRVVSASFDRTLRVWALDTARILTAPDGHADVVSACAVIPGGRAVSASYDGTLKIWDLAPGRIVETLKGHDGWVTGCAVTSNGRRMISASEDKTLKVWDLEGLRVLATLTGHADAVSACAVIPGGGAVSASYDGTLKVWDFTEARALATLDGHAGVVTACAVTPDGERVISASADHTLRIWELATGRSIPLEGHAGAVSACALTPDGRRMISASADGTLKVWDLDTRRDLATLAGHTGAVSACAVTPDGRRVVSTSADRTLKVWDLSTAGCVLTHHADTVFPCVVAAGGGIIAGDMVGTVWFLDWPFEPSSHPSRS